MKKNLFLLMTACAFFFAACSGGSPKTPTCAATNYLGAVKDGKYDKAINCFAFDQTEPTDQMVDEMNMLADKMEASLEEQGGMTDFEIISETISEDGTTARVEALVTYGDGRTETTHLKLKNIDDVWHIDPASK